MMKIKKQVWIVGLLSLIYSTYLHFTLGMDGFWDTANYHIYNGWAMSHLFGYSFGAVAQYHTYLNPVIDFINYNTFSFHPFVGAAFHSFVFCLTIMILFLIASTVYKGKSELDSNILSFFAVMIGATGAMTVSLFGSWTNEHITAMLLITALFLSVRYLEVNRLKLIFFAGFFAGMALGLKLTSVPFVIALLISVVLVSKFHKKTLIFIVAGAFSGLMLTDGPFMLLRFLDTGNPVFPLANNIFHSPYAEDAWKSFSKFEISQTFSYLSLPIQWLSTGNFSEESSVRDGRFLLAYIGLLMFVLAAIFKKVKINKQEILIILTFIFTWLLWILAFRIYRYLVVLELLSGIVFLMGTGKLIHLTNMATKIILIILTTVFLYYTTVYPNWGRRPWSDNFIKTNLASLLKPNEGAVFFTSAGLVSYLAPELNSLGIGFANLNSQSWYDGYRKNKVTDPISTLIQTNKKTYFIQFQQLDLRSESLYLSNIFKEHKYVCSEINTNMLWNPYICHYEKVSNVPEIKLNTFYHHDSDKIIFLNGWSYPENGSRWTEGKKSTIWFKLPKKDIKCQPVLAMKGTTLGKQNLTLTINGNTLATDTLNGSFEIWKPIKNEGTDSFNNKIIKLDLALPNAKKPGGNDPRILALSFDSLEVQCERNQGILNAK